MENGEPLIHLESVLSRWKFSTTLTIHKIDLWLRWTQSPCFSYPTCYEVLKEVIALQRWNENRKSFWLQRSTFRILLSLSYLSNTHQCGATRRDNTKKCAWTYMPLTVVFWATEKKKRKWHFFFFRIIYCYRGKNHSLIRTYKGWK